MNFILRLPGRLLFFSFEKIYLFINNINIYLLINIHLKKCHNVKL